MYLKRTSFLTGFSSMSLFGRAKSAVAPCIKLYTVLFIFSAALIFMATLSNNTWASEGMEAEKYQKIDARWLPWVGSWQLVSTKINTGESFTQQEYLLTISPGTDGNSIIMKGQQEDKVLVEEEVIADGLRHPLKDEKCSGYYVYSWSETGKRLLLNSESNCPGDPPRKISGMSIIDNNRDWLDIQVLQNGTEKAVSIRKYRNINSDAIPSGLFNPDQISASRITAAKNFTINEIIELSGKVEPEVLESALLEIRKPFPINSKQIARLSDSGVNSRIVDLMVAFSFPDKFNVGQEAISLAQAGGAGGGAWRAGGMHYRFPYNYYSYYCPILPWHWTSSCYMSYAYGYSYLGWYLSNGYYYPLWTYYPVYYEGGGGGGGGAVRGTGTMIQGRGYAAVPGSSDTSTRYARPRNAPLAQGVQVKSSSYSSRYGGPSSSTSYKAVTTGSQSGNPSYAQPRNAPAVQRAPVQSSAPSTYSGGSSYGSSIGTVTSGSSSGSSGSSTASPNGYSSGGPR